MNLRHQWDREAFKAAARRARGTMEGAVRASAKDLAKDVQTQGRAEIGRALHSKRWERGFQTWVFPRTPNGSLDVTVRGRHRIGYANIFERGGTIRGRPLLWIPLPSAPAKIGGRPTTAGAFVREVGPLHTIRRPGKPPLLAGYSMRAPGPGRKLSVAQLRTGQRNTRRRAARAAFGGRLGRRPVSVPLFVGIPVTRIADRMDVSAVYDRARRNLPKYYSAHFRKLNT